MEELPCCLYSLKYIQADYKNSIVVNNLCTTGVQKLGSGFEGRIYRFRLAGSDGHFAQSVATEGVLPGWRHSQFGCRDPETLLKQQLTHRDIFVCPLSFSLYSQVLQCVREFPYIPTVAAIRFNYQCICLLNPWQLQHSFSQMKFKRYSTEDNLSSSFNFYNLSSWNGNENRTTKCKMWGYVRI